MSTDPITDTEPLTFAISPRDAGVVWRAVMLRDPRFVTAIVLVVGGVVAGFVLAPLAFLPVAVVIVVWVGTALYRTQRPFRAGGPEITVTLEVAPDRLVVTRSLANGTRSVHPVPAAEITAIVERPRYVLVRTRRGGTRSQAFPPGPFAARPDVLTALRRLARRRGA